MWTERLFHYRDKRWKLWRIVAPIVDRYCDNVIDQQLDFRAMSVLWSKSSNPSLKWENNSYHSGSSRTNQLNVWEFLTCCQNSSNNSITTTLLTLEAAGVNRCLSLQQPRRRAGPGSNAHEIHFTFTVSMWDSTEPVCQNDSVSGSKSDAWHWPEHRARADAVRSLLSGQYFDRDWVMMTYTISLGPRSESKRLALIFWILVSQAAAKWRTARLQCIWNQRLYFSTHIPRTIDGNPTNTSHLASVKVFFFLILLRKHRTLFEMLCAGTAQRYGVANGQRGTITEKKISSFIIIALAHTRNRDHRPHRWMSVLRFFFFLSFEKTAWKFWATRPHRPNMRNQKAITQDSSQCKYILYTFSTCGYQWTCFPLLLLHLMK